MAVTTLRRLDLLDRRCPSCSAAASSAAATSGCSGRSSAGSPSGRRRRGMELVTAAPILGAALLALESAGADGALERASRCAREHSGGGAAAAVVQ